MIKKSLFTWWLQYRKVEAMFKVSPASLQALIDSPNCVLEDRVQYSTVHIPNVFCDGHLQIISCVRIVRKVHRDFLITLYNYIKIRSRGRVGCTVTRLRAERSGVRILALGNDFFSFPQNVETGAGVHPASHSMGSGSSFHGGKADCSPPLSPPPYALCRAPEQRYFT